MFWGLLLQSLPLVNSIVGDAMDATFIRDLVGVNKFDSVINCIGLLNQVCEEHKANAVYLKLFLFRINCHV